MKIFKVNYLAPNTIGRKTRSGKIPVYIHKVATYHCNTEEEAVEKFNKYHNNKNHTFQFIWEETGIDRLRKQLTKVFTPQ